MPRLTKSKKKTIYRMFARGETDEAIAAQMGITRQHVEFLYTLYLELPLPQKLRLAQSTEAATSRSHRLADDIRDIEHIDALLGKVDEKTFISLLDIKRKIKERMMKDAADNAGNSTSDISPELQEEIDQYYREIVGEEPPARKISRMR
jgi:hypothetical protein